MSRRQTHTGTAVTLDDDVHSWAEANPEQRVCSKCFPGRNLPKAV